MKRILNKGIYFFTINERGATAVEYVLMVALIAVTIMAAVTVFGLGLRGEFENNTAAIGIAFGASGS